MGFFDGVSGNFKCDNYYSPLPRNDFASTAHIARLLDLPVLLVIYCSRLSGSVAAIAQTRGTRVKKENSGYNCKR